MPDRSIGSARQAAPIFALTRPEWRLGVVGVSRRASGPLNDPSRLRAVHCGVENSVTPRSTAFTR